ncbi:hypothetical protein E2605_12260 [Dysgonomonas capnocytophagoides]|uniref:Uncharacterized protein n=1 Tax=Dysgonomonas capnocytophagoides TaxID=45254 RepID=A0A4Y8L039_9BACT|nr:hypothetical protein [Dysgonomonas capnocytophagoides]TFD95607.1 hypothetical protein E2605_12260 [Dysgonomonas capnocytophagoides]
MAKSVIIIEEETTKDENGKTLLKRTVTANILKCEVVVHEDKITPMELHNTDTPLDVFERWVLKLHTEKTSTL